MAALAILAIIALPSLLINRPEEKSEERTSGAEEKVVARPRVRYQDLMVREPVNPVEGASPEFWLATSKQWLADQVMTQVQDFLIFFDFKHSEMMRLNHTRSFPNFVKVQRCL